MKVIYRASMILLKPIYFFHCTCYIYVHKHITLSCTVSGKLVLEPRIFFLKFLRGCGRWTFQAIIMIIWDMVECNVFNVKITTYKTHFPMKIMMYNLLFSNRWRQEIWWTAVAEYGITSGTPHSNTIKDGRKMATDTNSGCAAF